MTPQMIVFDCDGVLVDSEVLSIRAMTGVLKDAGVPVTYGMIARYFGMKQADILIKLADETGANIGVEVAERIWPAIRDLFERELRPMPGVIEFLERHSEVKRCVASSSSPERIRNSLRLTGLTGYFNEAIFSSSQVARGKPAPDLFLFAAATMDVDPRSCVVIEDSAIRREGRHRGRHESDRLRGRKPYRGPSCGCAGFSRSDPCREFLGRGGTAPLRLNRTSRLGSAPPAQFSVARAPHGTSGAWRRDRPGNCRRTCRRPPGWPRSAGGRRTERRDDASWVRLR